MVRRIVGTALAVLLVAGARLATVTLGAVPGAYDVTVVLGRAAGVGLGAGSDVKLRGVHIGRVTGLRIVDGEPQATLELRPDPPVPRSARPVVTAKTLLGEKQLELVVAGPLDGPFLADGDRLEVAEGDEPTELDLVVSELERVLGAVDPDRLATLVDAAGAFDTDDARTLRRALDAGAELAAFGARTGEAQVDRLARLADVVSALEDRGDDLNRAVRAAPEAFGVLTDREADLAALAPALGSFAVGLAELLEHERPTLRRLFTVSDTIGTVVDPRIPEIGRMILGISRYALVFGQHGGSLDDGSEHAWFRAFIGEEGAISAFCEGLPAPLREAAPGCARPSADGRDGGAP